jgi:hypothetical protein
MARKDAPAGWRIATGGALALVSVCLATEPASAIDFTYGEIQGNFLTSLSAGMQIRTSKRQNEYVSNANRGLPAGAAVPGLTANADDGNLNFDRGDIVSAPLKITNELDAKWRNYGVYARGTAYYDPVFADNDLSRNGPSNRPYNGELNQQARDKAARGAEVLDLFVRGQFDVGGNPLNVRVGKQTISWGEALFTQNGINVINPLDGQKLVVPGSELRDALVSVPMAWSSYRIAEGFSVEGFYQWDFEPFRLPVTGTYFSTSDLLTPETVGLGGVGVAGDCGVPNGLCVQQGPIQDNDNSGNYGAALRYFSQELNNTEFGIYYIHYTSRYPSLNYNVTAGTTPAGTFLRNITAQVVYPEDISLIGTSFNTSWDEEGVALNGEFSFKHDVPANIYGVTTVRDALNRVGAAPFLGAPTGLPNQLDPTCSDGTPPCANFRVPGTVLGYVQVDAYNFNLRGSKTFFTSAPMVSAIGADNISAVAEVAVIYVPDLPTTEVLAISPFPSNRFTPGAASPFQDPVATQVSSGATTTLAANYLGVANTAIGLTPSISYSQTIQGTTPIAGGFLKDFKAANFSLRADYLINLSATINYAMRWGGSYRNLNADRDFVGLTVNYSF